MSPRNPYICLTIVATIGVAALVGMAGLIILPLMGHESPPSLVAITSTCLGALASFLVSVPRGSIGSETQPGQQPGPRDRSAA